MYTTQIGRPEVIKDSYLRYFFILNKEIKFDSKSLSSLRSLYDSSDRHYHNNEHINQCLFHLNDFFLNNNTRQFLKLTSSDKKRLWRIVYVSILYHDIVYNPYDRFNELNSAELFLSDGIKWLNSDDTTAVYNTILMTARHLHEFSDSELKLYEALMLDIDLAGFADGLRNDDLTIRQEFKHIDDYTYYSNRRNFLQCLINKRRIYYTDFFKTKYEESARQNIINKIYHCDEMIAGLKNEHSNK